MLEEFERKVLKKSLHRSVFRHRTSVPFLEREKDFKLLLFTDLCHFFVLDSAGRFFRPFQPTPSRQDEVSLGSEHLVNNFSRD
jgi:hypothetical protein